MTLTKQPPQKEGQFDLKELFMNRRNILAVILATGCYIATAMLMPGMANAETYPRIEKAMADLKAMAEKLGEPRLEGEEAVG